MRREIGYHTLFVVRPNHYSREVRTAPVRECTRAHINNRWLRAVQPAEVWPILKYSPPKKRKARWRDRTFQIPRYGLGRPMVRGKCARLESNQRPSAPQADVLSPELRAQIGLGKCTSESQPAGAWAGSLGRVGPSPPRLADQRVVVYPCKTTARQLVLRLHAYPRLQHYKCTPRALTRSAIRIGAMRSATSCALSNAAR